jgi:hypothetical protein
MKNDQDSSETMQNSLFEFEPEGIITTEIREFHRLVRDLEALLAETPECSDCQLKSKILEILKQRK